MKTCNLSKSQQLECLFGFHKYTIPIQQWGFSRQLLCEKCLRATHIPEAQLATEAWCDYDTQGRIIHYKDSSEYTAQWEHDYAGDVGMTRFTDSEGAEVIRPEVPEDRLKL